MSLVKNVKWIESKPLHVSVKDRTVVGITDRGLKSTNHMLSWR